MSEDLRKRARELSETMQCCCDLDKWEPERNTGHSLVCRIHKAVMAEEVNKLFSTVLHTTENLVEKMGGPFVINGDNSVSSLNPLVSSTAYRLVAIDDDRGTSYHMAYVDFDRNHRPIAFRKRKAPVYTHPDIARESLRAMYEATSHPPISSQGLEDQTP